MKIVALIVTHNRAELLGRCLDHIKSQTRRPDGIIVINNGSTDETESLLASRQVECISQDNLGAAAGWHTGLEYALSRGYEAVWLMDDDGCPDTRALELLEPRLGQGVACASSIVLQIDRNDLCVFPFPIVGNKRNILSYILPLKTKKLAVVRKLSNNGLYPFVHLFNGSLISADAVRNVGNVNKEYFIYGDEVDYFFRLKEYGKVFTVVDAFHFHPRIAGRPYNDVKIYYYIKNTIIINTKYWRLPWLRQIPSISLILYRIYRNNGVKYVSSLLFGAKSKHFYRALFRGFNGEIGRDF